MTEYYDYILLSIPVSFILFTLALFAVGLSMNTALLAASFPTVAIVGHAMFINGPTNTTTQINTDN